MSKKPTHEKQSGNIERGTPWPLYQAANIRWGPFNWDGCASKGKSRCVNYITPEMDAFSAEASEALGAYPYPLVIFLNPPYGRGVTPRWLELARRWTRDYGATVVCLIPASVGTKWWGEQVARAEETAEVVFLEGRVKFLDEDGEQMDGADFDSAFVVYRAPLAWPHWRGIG